MEFVIHIQKLEKLHVMFWLHTEIDPSRAEWDVGFQTAIDYRTKHGCQLADTRGIVITDGGAPGTRERARMAADLPCKWAVVTTVLTNPIKRGIATAIAWANPRFLFTEPRQLAKALEHLDLSDEREEVWQIFGDLQRRLRHNRTLDLIAEACGLPPHR